MCREFLQDGFDARLLLVTRTWAIPVPDTARAAAARRFQAKHFAVRQITPR
jgi:hypothetical protein